jgi:hypothetical protein
MKDASRGIEPMRPRARYIIAYPPLLFGSWMVAWLINLALRERFHWDASADTIYWIALKAIVWVLPALLAIRVIERESLSRFLELSHARRGAIGGGVIGLALVAVTFLGKTLPAGTPAHLPSFSLLLLNAVVVAPVDEASTVCIAFVAVDVKVLRRNVHSRVSQDPRAIIGARRSARATLRSAARGALPPR